MEQTSIPVSKKKKWKTFAVNVSIMLVAFLLIFFVLEIGFRVADWGTPEPENYFRFYTLNHSTYNPFLIFGPNINEMSPQENREIAYWNSQGFRAKEAIPIKTPPHEYRVIALGGSTTENMANKQNIHYCGVADLLLQKERFKGKQARCVNGAASGYSTAHTLVRLQFDIQYFDPDMITVMHNVNDLTVNFFPWQYQQFNYGNKYFFPTYARRVDQEPSLYKKSKLLVAIANLIDRMKTVSSSEKIKTPEGEKIYSNMRFSEERIPLKTKLLFRNNLKGITGLAKTHDIALVFMSQPAFFSDDKIALLFGHEEHNKHILYPKKEELQRSFELYNKIIEDVAKEEGVYFIDMATLMGKDETLFFDMVHFTPKGIQRFGEIYARELKKILNQEMNKK